MKNEVRELQSYFCPFGSLDVNAVCEIGDEIGLSESELFEIIDEDREALAYDNFEQFDPVASVLGHILQMARNHIEEITDYDFLNDYSGNGSEIYTYGNFMCSSYDYSKESKDELTTKIKDHYALLIKNKWCKYFLEQLDIRAE